MFHEYKIIGGILHQRFLPDGKFTPVEHGMMCQLVKAMLHAPDDMIEQAKTLIDAYYGEPGAKAEVEEDKGRLSEHPCEKCGAMEVYVQEINDYPDYRITCHACGRSYCVDGIDA